MRKSRAMKAHELAKLLMQLPNLPVYRILDHGEDENGELLPIGAVAKLTACDEDENPTIDCIVLDGGLQDAHFASVGKPATVAEPANIIIHPKSARLVWGDFSQES
jgi:hypothetical protein